MRYTNLHFEFLTVFWTIAYTLAYSGAIRSGGGEWALPLNRITPRCDISVSKISSLAITVLCVLGSFKFLLYYCFGKHFRFSFSFYFRFRV